MSSHPTATGPRPSTPKTPTPSHDPRLQATLPEAASQRQVSEARAAITASMSNLVDSQLQSRAAVLHDNAAALDKQERQVLRATDSLRREREKLSREADGAAKKLKEVGNVQNWAEVLERGFLVLEETMRLVEARGGGSDDDGDDDESLSDGDEGMMDVDVDLAHRLQGGDGVQDGHGKV